LMLCATIFDEEVSVGSVMAFSERTGQRRRGNCETCHAATLLEETRIFLPRVERHWRPVAHRAPCGANCLSGGVTPGETDVHGHPFFACPRCGVSRTTIAQIIVRDDGTERLVVHRYHTEGGHRIDLEIANGSGWVVKHRWRGGETLPDTLQRALQYVRWLKPPNGSD
jgi:hypothetical protein